MNAFIEYLAHRDVEVLLRLLENAEFFNPRDYNPAFESELNKLLNKFHDPEIQQQVSALLGYDFGSYISRSLLRSGFRDDNQQEAFQEIVIRLLVNGKLFSGWVPGKHGALERRFRRSVWNSIRNISEKNRNRMKRVMPSDPSVMSGMYAARKPYSDLIDQFRQLVGQQLGQNALEILDQRLSNRDIKDLIGAGRSSYFVKREVQSIKDLAERFSDRLGDPNFARMLRKAMEHQAASVEKRKAAMAARQSA